MKKIFTAFIEYDEESNLYVGIVPNVPGAHTQAEKLDELQHNLQEVLELCLEENPELADDTLHFSVPSKWKSPYEQTAPGRSCVISSGNIRHAR